MTVHKVDHSTYREFINEKPIAVVHFYAIWNRIDDEMRVIIQSVADAHRESVNIGELDVDESPQTAIEMKILNVPTVIYYRDGQVVEQVIGLASNLNVAERIQALLSQSYLR